MDDAFRQRDDVTSMGNVHKVTIGGWTATYLEADRGVGLLFRFGPTTPEGKPLGPETLIVPVKVRRDGPVRRAKRPWNIPILGGR